MDSIVVTLPDEPEPSNSSVPENTFWLKLTSREEAALTALHDPAWIGPEYYAQWSKGPSTALDYFPILAYHMNLNQWSGLPQRLVDCNINGVMMAFDQTNEGVVQTAKDYGMTIVGISALQRWGDPAVANNIDTVYPSLQNIITAYSMADEPNQGNSVYEKYGNGTEAQDVGAAKYVEDSTAQKLADPNRPIIGNFTKDVFEWNLTGPPGWDSTEVERHNRTMLQSLNITSGDVYGWVDEYEWYQDDPTYGTHHVGAWVYGHLIDRLRFYNPNAPGFGFVELCRSGDGVNTIMPGMVKTAVWNIIAHGGRGYTYWPRDFYGQGINLYAGANEFIGEFSAFADHQFDAQAAAAGQVNGEVQALTTRINSPTILGFSAVGQSGVPVTVLAKDFYGKLWMLVQSDGNESHPMSNQTNMTATITVPSAISPGTVLNVVGEGRTVTVNSSHQFTDTFGTTTETPWATVRTIPPITYGYAHHIYEQV